MDIVVEKDLADAGGENRGLKARFESRGGVERRKERGRTDIEEEPK